MPRRNLDVPAFWKESQGFHAGVPAGLFQMSVMCFRTDKIENSTGNPEVGPEVFETVKNGCYAIGCRFCIDDQYDGQLQQSGDFGTAAQHPVITIEQTHDAFGDTYIGILAVTGIYFTEVFRRCHERIQIIRFPSGSSGMVFGVQIIRSAFKRSG